MPTPIFQPDPEATACARCAQPRRPDCATCMREAARSRRRAAAALVRAGAPIRHVAREMGIARRSLQREVRAGEDRMVPNAAIRAAVEAARAADPDLTWTEIARRAEPRFSSGVHVSRLLGRVRTARVRDDGREYPPRYVTEISVENAVRLIRAAGLDPLDFPDL